MKTTRPYSLHAAVPAIVLGFLLGLVGCGTIPVTPEPPDAGSPDGAVLPDAAMDAATPCDLSAPFGNLRPVPGVNSTEDDFNPSLSLDELTIYFFNNSMSPGTADHDLYFATRPSRDDSFGSAMRIGGLSSTSDDRGGFVSADGLRFYFHSSRTGNYDLYVASRSDLASEFGPPAPLIGVNTNDSEANPIVSADGQTLYFERQYDPGTGILFEAAAGPTGFTAAIEIAELSTPNGHAPQLSSDGLTMYIASNRPGGAGNFDIWRAARPSETAAFGEAEPVTELNATGMDMPDWLSADGCRIYFTTERFGGPGKFDIWQANRPQ